MNKDVFKLAEGYVTSSYIRQGAEAYHMREKMVKTLFSQRRMPSDGWDESTVELFLQQLSLMDTSNFPHHIPAGEREGRLYSSLVGHRNYRLAHGIGRSGDIAAHQPKASGSTLLQSLCSYLALDALQIAGASSTKSCLVMPLATGMALTLCLLTAKQSRPEKAKFVIWPRVDQKTCLKCIVAGGFVPHVVEGEIVNGIMEVSPDAVSEAVDACGGEENVVAVLLTTSCFIPRSPDNILPVARMCKDRGIPLVVNNAFGVQMKNVMRRISDSIRLGRVDAYVQSTDKNFMVPVGGSIVASGNKEFVKDVSKLYPGRASISPSIDLFITLLEMGQSGWKRVLKEREELFPVYLSAVGEIGEEFRERIIHSPENPVSFAMTLDTFKNPGAVGSMLFHSGVTGMRVYTRATGKETVVGGVSFQNYGAHNSDYPSSYLTTACAVGMTHDEIERIVHRLRKILKERREKEIEES